MCYLLLMNLLNSLNKLNLKNRILELILEYPIAVSLTFKLVIVIILGISVLETDLFLVGYDETSYISPCINFLKYGVYGNTEVPLANRMPSIGVIYASLKLILNEYEVRLCIVALHILSDFLISLYIYKICKLLIENRIIAVLILLIYNLNTFVLVWSFFVYTDILGTLFFIISLYYLILFTKNKEFQSIVISGLGLILAIFFRNFFVIYLPIFIIYLFYILKGLRFKIISVCYFSIFIVIIDGIWITRNYINFQKIIPLQTNTTAGYEYTKTYTELKSLVSNWGLDNVAWNPKAEILFFDDFNTRYKSPIDELPQYVYTSHYKKAFFDTLRNDLKDARLEIQENDEYISNKIKKANKEFKLEHPFRYYFYAPLNISYKFLFHSGTYNISSKPFAELNFILKLFKISMSIQYLLVVFLGLMGSFILIVAKLKSNTSISLICFINLIGIFALNFVLKAIEYRYFVYLYPTFVIIATLIFFEIYSIINNRKAKRE